MSRLRRLVVSNRFFFTSCRLLPRRGTLPEAEFDLLARVIGERRKKYHFLLTAWVFLPDHWHAIFYPRHPLTMSRVMEAIKDGATKRINRGRREAGMLWQKSRRGIRRLTDTSALPARNARATFCSLRIFRLTNEAA